MIKKLSIKEADAQAKKYYEDKKRASRLYSESLKYDPIHWRYINPKELANNPEKFIKFYNRFEEKVGTKTPIVYIFEAVDKLTKQDIENHSLVKKGFGTTPSLRVNYSIADVMYVGSKLGKGHQRIGQHLIGRNVYKSTNTLGIEAQNTCLKLSKWYSGRVHLTVIPLPGCGKAGINHIEAELKNINTFMFGRKEN
jgi:hypothetical protein